MAFTALTCFIDHNRRVVTLHQLIVTGSTCTKQYHLVACSKFKFPYNTLHIIFQMCCHPDLNQYILDVLQTIKPLLEKVIMITQTFLHSRIVELPAYHLFQVTFNCIASVFLVKMAKWLADCT